ncbi:MAG: HAMP domain-containing sensor histidine kinase [Calothrix sp. MO_192.B10]|nr:HAMP domain-containing sensor histidine kinase [Calothrix sp. MO_192.B10]
MSESITADIFAALNILVLEKLKGDCYQLIGTVPDWAKTLCPYPVESGHKILLKKAELSFLENFLIDAEEFWEQDESQQPQTINSGIWNHVDDSDNEYFFEATAIKVNNQKIILIKHLAEEYQQQQNIIQKARENQLDFQYSVKESQKKDILIHCIIHDMAGQLSGINCCFALLDLENLTPKGKETLNIGKQQTIKQEMLIREILDAFSVEMQSLEAFTVNPEIAPDALLITQQIIQVLTPSFSLNHVELKLAADVNMNADWKVVGDKSRLERVITNLTENALHHSPPNTTVTIGLQQDDNTILVTIDDQGKGVAPEIAKNLFKKFAQGTDRTGKVGLGLYFCRITVERWGGEIGYSPLPENGSRFWFSLPKATDKQ